MEPRPRPEPRRPALVVALFVAVTWAAASFAVAGILAVLFDRDPVESPAPVYAGPGALALAGIAVWLTVGFTAAARRPWFGAVAAAASVYLVVVAVAVTVSFPVFVEQAASPFVIAAAVLAALAVIGTWGVLRGPPNAGLSGPSPDS